MQEKENNPSGYGQEYVLRNQNCRNPNKLINQQLENNESYKKTNF